MIAGAVLSEKRSEKATSVVEADLTSFPFALLHNIDLEFSIFSGRKRKSFRCEDGAEIVFWDDLLLTGGLSSKPKSFRCEDGVDIIFGDDLLAGGLSQRLG